MRRVFSLLMVLMLTFSFLPGCGGSDSSTPEEQEKQLEETEANMDAGMDAMKDVSKTGE